MKNLYSAFSPTPATCADQYCGLPPQPLSRCIVIFPGSHGGVVKLPARYTSVAFGAHTRKVQPPCWSVAPMPENGVGAVTVGIVRAHVPCRCRGRNRLNR